MFQTIWLSPETFLAFHSGACNISTEYKPMEN